MESNFKKRKWTYTSEMSHLLRIEILPKPAVLQLLTAAEKMRELCKTAGGDDRLKRKVLCCVFYEPSTRTNCSFQAAMLRLGGKVIVVNEQHSSVKKGESLSDTIMTISGYCDVIVLRHPEKGICETASLSSTVPVINAGDGVGEHPTQALLDLFTIQSELEFCNNSGEVLKPITVVFVGDLKNGRTVHSLALLLAMFPDGVNLHYVHPLGLGMPEHLMESLRRKGVRQAVGTLEEVIAVADVVYVTRCQRERFESVEEYEKVSGLYHVNAETLKAAKADMIVMHPLPRLNELSEDVDDDPRAAYFRQARNGMFMRMAILEHYLDYH